MYDITPSRVFVSDQVLNNPDALARLKRFMKATGTTDYEVVSDERIPWMIQQPEWINRDPLVQFGSRPQETAEPIFFFNINKFDNDMDKKIDKIITEITGLDPSLEPNTTRKKLSWVLGYRNITWFNPGHAPTDVKPDPQHICRTCWRLNFSPGCTHQCLYCGLVGRMVVGLNVEEYLRELEQVIKETPWQTTYLGDDASDLLILEPELGLVEDVCKFFARQNDPERYFIIHTKSANVDFLKDVDHRGHTIMCWSLSAQTQSTEMEAGSGSMEQRLIAAEKCEQWGMPVRFKFKPFIPVVNWRDEAREMIKMMFEKTHPDNLSMTVLMWMNFEDLSNCIGLDRIDPKFADAARKYASQQEKEGTNRGPFPPEVRCEIYEFLLKEIRAIDSEIPVTISTESTEVWKHMKPLLGVDIGTYVCGCGPCSTPGLKTLPQDAWETARTQIPARIAKAAGK